MNGNGREGTKMDRMDGSEGSRLAATPCAPCWRDLTSLTLRTQTMGFARTLALPRVVREGEAPPAPPNGLQHCRHLSCFLSFLAAKLELRAAKDEAIVGTFSARPIISGSPSKLC